jgi:hypothetical protein
VHVANPAFDLLSVALGCDIIAEGIQDAEEHLN